MNGEITSTGDEIGESLATTVRSDGSDADGGTAAAAIGAKADSTQQGAGAALTLAAMGIVYGDIGTSPLYALRECFHGPLALAVSPTNVLGVLSLILWSLILIISVKYLGLVMRADNDGEGGIVALMVLAREQLTGRRARWSILIMGLFGAGLLYGDGVITPAISVLSAVEGLQIAAPASRPLVIPLCLGILVALFLLQKRGTAHVGKLFGPVMAVWFTTLSVLGVLAIAAYPSVLSAANPYHAVNFFAQNRLDGFLILGVIFLVVTGGEALYADMGHFGARPIRTAWFAFVLPALLMNYFGQGALLLSDPTAVENPFYHLAPHALKYPLVLLATIATVIASQAIITGAFSLAYQAVQLGLMPRLTVVHTSAGERGQVYVPAVNWALLATVLTLVLTFKSSSNLAAAYGMAVTCTMVITALLLYVVARNKWGWSRLLATSVIGLFLCIDLGFLTANVVKIWRGGWLPLVIGAGVCVAMATWKRGRAAMAAVLMPRLAEGNLTLQALLDADPPTRIGTPAVYLTSNVKGVPLALMHNLRHNRVLHKPLGLLSIVVEPRPYVPLDQRVEVKPLGRDMYRIIAHYGFKQAPNIPNVLAHCRESNVDFSGPETSYFLGRLSIGVDGDQPMRRWRKQFFAWMTQNARDASRYFGIPPDQVVEIGARVDI